MLAERPLSPHLQIYRLPLAAVLSISHRISGVLLTGAAVGLALLIAIAPWKPALWDCTMGLLHSWAGQGLLLALTFALAFHFSTGLRHLIWDTGVGFSKSAVAASNWLVLTSAVSLTALVWCGLAT